MQRISIAVAAAVIALAMTTSATAGARSSESFEFADPFSGSYDCPGFATTYSGHDSGHVTTWFDAAGDPIMQIGHIKAWETDVNESTGKAISVNTDLLVHVDYAAGTTTITGARNLSTDSGKGVVVQHVGRVVFDSDGQLVFGSGKHPEFDPAYVSEDFCAALA